MVQRHRRLGLKVLQSNDAVASYTQSCKMVLLHLWLGLYNILSRQPLCLVYIYKMVQKHRWLGFQVLQSNDAVVSYNNCEMVLLHLWLGLLEVQFRLVLPLCLNYGYAMVLKHHWQGLEDRYVRLCHCVLYRATIWSFCTSGRSGNMRV